MSEDFLFPPESVDDIQTIMLFRLYDVAISILMEMNEGKAIKLSELHKVGGLLSPDAALDPDEIRR